MSTDTYWQIYRWHAATKQWMVVINRIDNIDDIDNALKSLPAGIGQRYRVIKVTVETLYEVTT